MAAKKKTKTEKIEREYTIPLREKCRSVAIYKKTPKAIKTVKEFLARHMKVENRDLNKIKLDRFVNEALWARGIKKPLHKIKVKAVKKDGVVKVELYELTKKFKDKQAREVKRSALGDSNVKKKATPMKKDDTKDESKDNKIVDKDKDGVDDKVEVKEKEASVEELNKEEAKANTAPKAEDGGKKNEDKKSKAKENKVGSA